MNALMRLVSLERGERGRLALAVALSAAATGAAIALLATSGYLVSRAAQRPMIIALSVAIVGVRAFGIARAVLRYAERLSSHDLALRTLARLRTRFYRRLAPLVPGELHGRRRGNLLSRFVADVDTLQDLHLRVVIPALVAAAVVAGASLAAALMLTSAGAVFLVTLAASAMGSSWLSAAIAAGSGRHQAPARARLTGVLIEAVDGSAELAVAGRSVEHAARLRAADRGLARLSRRDAVAGALASGAHQLLTAGGLLAVLVLGVAAVHARTLPGVLLAAVALLFLGAGEAIAPLPMAARRLQAWAAASARLADVCEREPAIADPRRPRRPAGGGALALEHVALRYGEADDLVLTDVSLRIDAGERVALVGPSGAGKTTIAELLVRFLDPLAGRVTLDGLDARHMAQDELRRAVLLCGQDVHLFNTTIRENLLIAHRSATDEELWAALATVELEEFVAGLPDGLETRVGQHGELVSGGQRRRLALARALLSDSRFLILDEPVAHLDAPLAQRIIARLLAAAGMRGLLVITHDVDSLARFDRVLQLDRGRLVSATVGKGSMKR